MAEKQRYVYIWNGIPEVGGRNSFDEAYSSRKKAILFAIDKCERYGYIDPQVSKKSGNPINLLGHTEIVDYQGEFLGFVKLISVL